VRVATDRRTIAIGHIVEFVFVDLGPKDEAAGPKRK